MTNQNVQQRAKMRSIHGECLSAYDQLLQRDPSDSEAFMHMMWARKFACDWSNFGANMEKMISLMENAVSGMCGWLHAYVFMYTLTDIYTGTT